MVPSFLLDANPLRPLKPGEAVSKLEACRLQRIEIGGHKNVYKALENIETLTDKQLDFWMERSFNNQRLQFFEGLGQREPTPKMKRWISSPKRLEWIGDEYVLAQKSRFESNFDMFVRVLLTYWSDDAVGPHLVDLAIEYKQDHLVPLIESDPRVNTPL